MSDVFIDECGNRIESVLLVADPNGGLTVSNTENDIIDRSKDKIIDYLEELKTEICELPTETLLSVNNHICKKTPMLATLFRDNTIAIINKYIQKRKEEL